MPRSCKAPILRSADGQYYFVIKGKNGEIQATSETYTRKFDAERAFFDLSQSMLSILWSRRALIDELIRANLLDKINDSL